MPPAPLRRRLLRRGLPALALVLVLGLVWLWPARRNFYGQLAGVEVRLDVPYVAGAKNPKQALDLFLPRAPGPHPLLVFVHGGYWSPLDRRWLEPLLGTHGNVGGAFARRGIAAAVLGYRQYPEIRRGDESLADIAHAVGFLHEQAAALGVDPRRIYLMGHSAGGQLVSLLALAPELLEQNGVPAGSVAGFVSVDGIFDLGASLSYLAPDQALVLRQLFGPDDASLRARSPYYLARGSHPPLLFIDSEGDEPVCRDGFHRMRARLRELGSPARFVELPGLGHNEAIVRVGMPSDAVTPLVADWLRR